MYSIEREKCENIVTMIWLLHPYCAICEKFLDLDPQKDRDRLIWHHMTGQIKKYKIPDLVKRGLIQELKYELPKCVLVCWSCHSSFHNPGLDPEVHARQVDEMSYVYSQLNGGDWRCGFTSRQYDKLFRLIEPLSREEFDKIAYRILNETQKTNPFLIDFGYETDIEEDA